MTSQIQTLSTPIHLAQANEICSPLGWGITLADWESYEKNFQVYGILDEESGKVIATSVLYPQPPLLTLGAVIVHPSFRNRGLAHKLVSYAIDSAEKDPRISRLGLLGSPMGSPIYSSLGFETVGMTRVWEGEVDLPVITRRLEQLIDNQKEVAAADLKTICPVESGDDWKKVYDITKRSFYNAERKIILEATGYGSTSNSGINFIGSIPLSCLIESQDGEPQAFGVTRPFPFPTSTSKPEELKNSELKINLLVASSSYLARLVVLQLLKGLPQGSKIKVEVQMENDGEEEIEWKKNKGETKVEGSLRSLLNEMNWKNSEGNKIMIYKCGNKDRKNTGKEHGEEKRWEKDGFRQFCPFDAL